MSKDYGIDDKIEAIIQKIESDRTEIAKVKSELQSCWVTNCSLKFGNSDSINIATASAPVLVESLTQLLMWEEFRGRADATLNQIAKPILFKSFYVKDWTTDIKKRMSMIELKQKETALAQLEKRAQAILSDDKRRQMEYDDILKTMGL